MFSENPLSAALIGAAVELAGSRAAYPKGQESPRGALLRKRTPSCSWNPVTPARACELLWAGLMTGARVVLFSSKRSTATQFRSRHRFGLSVIRCTATLESIAGVLETSWSRRGARPDGALALRTNSAMRREWLHGVGLRDMLPEGCITVRSPQSTLRDPRFHDHAPTNAPRRGNRWDEMPRETVSPMLDRRLITGDRMISRSLSQEAASSRNTVTRTSRSLTSRGRVAVLDWRGQRRGDRRARW